jgi:DNA polymerase V
VAAAGFAPLRVLTPDDLVGTDRVRVPLVGRLVSAGFPSPADDFAEEAIELPRWLFPNPAASYLWRAKGTSAVGAGIFDGDLVATDRSLDPVNRDMVIAVVDGDPTIKRYRMEDNRAVLAFENPKLPAFAIEDVGEVAIWGVILFSIRLHRPLPRGA